MEFSSEFENHIAERLGPRYVWAMHTEPVKILMSLLQQAQQEEQVLLEPLPGYGDHFTVPGTWAGNRGDGDAFWATATHMSRIPAGMYRPSWASHIIYFGK